MLKIYPYTYNVPQVIMQQGTPTKQDCSPEQVFIFQYISDKNVQTSWLVYIHLLTWKVKYVDLLPSHLKCLPVFGYFLPDPSLRIITLSCVHYSYTPLES